MRTLLTISLLLSLLACNKTDAGSKPAQSVATVHAPVETATQDTEIPATTSNPQALEAYRIGFAEYNNARLEEARKQFKKASDIDPTFISARAMEGASIRDSEGEKILAEAIAKAGALPEAERVHLQFRHAFAMKDGTRAIELAKKLTELVPNAWVSHLLYAWALSSAAKHDESILACKKALEINPKAGPVYNHLAYGEFYLGNVDDAVMHIKKYIEISPNEVNAQDSLGEMLLMGGKYDEAETAFKKAIEMNANYVSAWHGLALVRFYKGDWSGAYEALGKLNDIAPTVFEKGIALRETMWGQLTQGKVTDAAKTMDTWEMEATKANDKIESVTAILARARLALETNKETDALKILATVPAKLDKFDPPAIRQVAFKAKMLTIEIMAEARLGKKVEADKSLGALEELLGKSESVDDKGKLAFARGQAALARGDVKAAVDAFEKCTREDDYCVWERAKAQEKAGDKAGAAATREKIQKVHRRSGIGFFVWSKVAPNAKK